MNVRACTKSDMPFVVRSIRELAEYERLLDVCHAEEGALLAHAFPEPPARAVIEILIGEIDGTPRGFALFFTNYSTFRCAPGIYLEDLYVHPTARGHGLGKALLTRLAQIAKARGCARLEWAVLDWNEPAIGFYRSHGATAMDEWTTFRLTGNALDRLGE